MKKIIFSLAFSSLLAFGPSINAAVAKTNASVATFKGDEKKKKKKSCESTSKEGCTKAKKSCCAKKEATQ
jgi:hypothetical protein